MDFKYYYGDFKEMGIDLIDDDIDWYKFNSVLQKIIFNNNSLMNKIIEFRTYEKPSGNIKTAESKIHKEKTRLKRDFALPQKKEIVENGLEKLWKYAEERSKQ